jgi:DNA-binding MarR family transcriptional regulator
MRHVRSQVFHNPATGNNVKFVSLAPAEQSKIYQSWRAIHRKTPAQQMAPAIAKRMSQEDQHAMDAVARRGTIDIQELSTRMDEDPEAARQRLDRLEQSGYVDSHETETGHEYWSPSALGYEILRQLNPTSGKTSNMETLNDWSFVAFHDPQKRKFRHPQTGNWVIFESLPMQEQMRFKQQMQQQQMQPQGQPAVVDSGGADMGDAGMGGGDGGGGMMAMDEEEIMERGEANTGEVEFGEPMAMEELEARMGDYLALEDMLGPGGLGIIPVSLGTPADPDTQHEGPDLDQEGEHMGCGGMEPTEPEIPEMDSWSFVADDEKEGAMQREMFAPVVEPKVMGPGEMVPEPPPPAQVRRMLGDRMREMGRGLMIAGSKAPRQQMMEIQGAMIGLMDQLEALADQPGREALRRRILLQLRPRVMRF